MLGPSDSSLSQAIRALNPDLSAESVKAEVKRAEKEAKKEIKIEHDPALAGGALFLLAASLRG